MADIFYYNPDIREDIENNYDVLLEASQLSQHEYIVLASEIANRHGCMIAEVMEYFKILMHMRQPCTSVVIFYNEKLLKAKDKRAFGKRYNQQIIPKGSVMVGIVSKTGVGLVTLPFSAVPTDLQQEYEDTLADARLTAGLLDYTWVEGPSGTLVLQAPSS